MWHPGENALFWVDIKGRAVHEFRPDDGTRRSYSVGEEIGCLVPRARGGWIAALRSGFAHLDLDGGSSTPVADPEADRPGNRFNDGKCDRRGRFWAGTMDDAATEPTGSVYRLSADGRVTRVLSGYIVTNGIGWSPDDRTMYFTDSKNKVILAYDFDAGVGELANERVFATVPAGEGTPDGLTVDAEGCVWSAHWDGWRITRYRPDGTIAEVIAMPVRRPTSCAFGGKGLDRLYVTSAREGLDEDTLAEGPLAGSLFEVRLGVCGLAEVPYAG